MTMLNKLFKGRSNDLIGLDISSSAVKLVELSQRGSQYTVECFAIEPLPEGAVIEKQVADPQAVAEVIVRALEQAGTRAREAAIAVAGSGVITKTIGLPASLREVDMEEQILADAAQYLPYPVDQVNLDFQPLTTPGPEDETVDVLLAACRREQVESRTNALELAGLTPRIVDIEVYALESACHLLAYQMPDQGRDVSVALLDMGATTTTLLVLRDGKVAYTRDQTFGGRQLTEEVMRQYGLNYQEAGRAKRRNELPDDYDRVILARFVEDMTQQVDRSLQFYYASPGRHDSISQLVLAGGCAQIPAVDTAIQEHLQMPTVVARPFGQMATSDRARPQRLAREEPSLMIATGLALRAFDEPR